MDASDSVATAHSFCPPAVAHPRGVGDSKARSVVSRDASQIRATPFAQIVQGLFGELVKSARGYIRPKLPIPQDCIELGEPYTERRKVLLWELAHRFLYLLNRAHSERVPRLRIQRNCQSTC